MSASLYEPIYYSVTALLSLLLIANYSMRNGENNYEAHGKGELFDWVIVISCILFIGFRPLHGHFIDMMSYNIHYYAFWYGTPFEFRIDTENLLFDNLFAFLGSLNLDIVVFFVIIACIYFGASYVGLKRLFPHNTTVAYLVFLAAFSTFSYGTNGIKAGSAASLFILALSYMNNLRICIPLIFISWGFHHSMQLPVAAFALTLFCKNTKLYFYFWLVCLLVAIFHIDFFQDLFANITDDKGSTYLMENDDDWGGKSGFRLDFVIYSAMPVVVYWWVVFKRKLQISKQYKCLIDIYLCTNGIWMLCMYAQFTNRIAYLSWFLYPIVLVYPILNENWGKTRYRTFANIMLAHLAFTLFMYFVYYAK